VPQRAGHAEPAVPGGRPSEVSSENPILAFPDEESWELSLDPAAVAAPRHGLRVTPGDRSEESDAEDRSDEGRPPPSAYPILEYVEATFDPEGDDEIEVGDRPDEEERGGLYEVAQVRLRDRTRASELDQGELQLAVGDQVVVETEQGYTLGAVERACQRTCCDEAPRRVLRKVDGNDLRQQARNFAREREAFQFCRERIKQRGLPMKLIRVEYLHGGNKAIFYFAAENRVDFRELVKDLAGRLHTRIVMRQVGVRDEAKMTGGIGSCGCQLCCASWLPRFEPVSIRMAKDQNLVLNPQKVSGQCGRLKCCLAYEEAQYVAARKGMPKVGRRVSTPGGEGKVQDVDILRQLVRVHHDDGSDQHYPATQVQPVNPAGPAPRDGQGD
jgi:cell fate regulator YaaT (PSP1 superfamily)